VCSTPAKPSYVIWSILISISARNQFRRAQLNAKRAAEAARQSEREAIFANLRTSDISTSTPGATSSTDLFSGRRQTTHKQLTEDELLITASSDVTSALRQTHDRLAGELTRSRFAAETLEQSEQALRDLGERYGTLDTLLSNSRSLLGTLVSSQKSDTWYLETAFYLLCVTLSWLVFRRLVYGPAWWFVWLPLRTFVLRPFVYVLSVIGITGGAAKTASLSASSVLQSTSTRQPLRIQPSATGGIPKFPDNIPRMGPAIPAGGGGMGAKVPPQAHQAPSQRSNNAGEGSSLSDKIGEMAEQSRQEAQQQQQQPAGSSEGHGPTKVEPARRADGTALEQRGEKPRNPKKKMFEADVEDARFEERRARDEL